MLPRKALARARVHEFVCSQYDNRCEDCGERRASTVHPRNPVKLNPSPTFHADTAQESNL